MRKLYFFISVENLVCDECSHSVTISDFDQKTNDHKAKLKSSFKIVLLNNQFRLNKSFTLFHRTLQSNCWRVSTIPRVRIIFMGKWNQWMLRCPSANISCVEWIQNSCEVAQCFFCDDFAKLRWQSLFIWWLCQILCSVFTENSDKKNLLTWTGPGFVLFYHSWFTHGKL